MKTLTIVQGPSLLEIQMAAVAHAVSADGKPPLLLFKVRDDAAEDETKGLEIECAYPIAGFFRYDGVGSPWSLTAPTTGEHALEKLTKLHFYPVAGKGHVEIFDNDE
ncbi:MAG: hypothetical protein WC050_01490 [Candidatus Paceibacterota bacterium]